MLKQEDKSMNGSNGVKAEVKSEIKHEAAIATLEIDAADFEERFEVMAMGVVADELPQQCVEPFLKFIKTNR